jgi:hypothetical protein
MLKIFGMKMSIYWITWFITLSIPAIIISLEIATLGKAILLFEHSNYFIGKPLTVWCIYKVVNISSLVFLYNLLFSISVITFGFLVGSVVSKTGIAVMVAAVWMYLLNTVSIYSYIFILILI